MPNLFALLCPSASGYRASNTGGLTNLGESGYTWSGSPYSATGVYGSHLVFDISAVSPEYGGRRSVGRPVRCVQE